MDCKVELKDDVISFFSVKSGLQAKYFAP
uniref:Uncharacterized protein n=1 Tax=Arundo donax TaxID=35708 RepID=A0A0A8YAU4_ARUDO